MIKRKLQKIYAGTIIACYGLVSSSVAATPLTTVPWNDHVGAVSLTFDDALENQVVNLKPILDEMPDVQVTFFLTSTSYYLTHQGGNKGFAALALAGHEIGNHSKTHGHFTGKAQVDDELLEEIVYPADTIEALLAAGGANVKVSAFATPYCANDDVVTAAINQRHFINRDCGDWGYRKSWNKEPDWFKFSALGWDGDTKTVENITVAMDTCIGNADFSGLKPWETPPGPEGEWMVVLHHGVEEESSGMSVGTADIKKILQHARDNKMWVAGFGTVGAYYKAHFTLDTASAIANDDGSYKVSWTLPHPQMPKSIPMKVKLNNEFLAEAFGAIAIRADGTVPQVVLEQNGKAIWPDSNNIYEIEFSTLNVKIRLETSEEHESKQDENPERIPSIGKSKLEADFTAHSPTIYSIFDINGNWLGQTNGFRIPDSMPKGVYIIRGQNSQMQTRTIKTRN